MCSRALEQLGCDTPETFSVNLRWENMGKKTVMTVMSYDVMITFLNVEGKP